MRYCLLALLFALPACQRAREASIGNEPTGIGQEAIAPPPNPTANLPDARAGSGSGGETNASGAEAQWGYYGLLKDHPPVTGQGFSMRTGTPNGQAHPGKGDNNDDINVLTTTRKTRRARTEGQPGHERL
jgi:hypothetical protein